MIGLKRKIAILSLALLLVTSGIGAGVAVAQEEQGDPEDQLPEPETDENVDESGVDSEVVVEIHSNLRVVEVEEYTDEKIVFIVESDRNDQSFSMIDMYQPRVGTGGDWVVSDSITVDEGTTRVTHYYHQPDPSNVGIEANGYGTVIPNPTASILDRPAEWFDHIYSVAAAILAFVCGYLYKLGKRKFHEKRDIHSLIDGGGR